MTRVRKGDAQYLETYFEDASYNSNWESPASLAKHIGSVDKSTVWDDAGWSREDSEHMGSKNMDETIEMARTGWPEGAKQVSKIREKVLARNPFRKQAVRYGIAGSTPNVPRAVSGNPMNMRMDDQARSLRRPTVTIIAQMGASWYIQPQRISNRAAAVAAIVDQIETAGYSCEVIAIAASYSGEFKSVTATMIKQSHHPVDIGRLAFGLGQASMFRRLCFADRGSEPSCRESLGHGLGSTYTIEPREDWMIKHIYTLPPASVNHYLFEDEEKTATVGVKFLIGYLREQGCPAYPGLPVG